MTKSTHEKSNNNQASRQRRLFLAVPVGEDIVEPALDSLKASLEALPPLNPVPRQNLHLTLIFLGNQPANAIEEKLIPVIEETLAQCHPGRIYLRQVAGFPTTRTPRHLALEGYASTSAQALQSSLREALAELLPQDKGKEANWRPHITLARFREKQPRAIEPVPWQAELPLGDVILYQSETTMHGPIYHEIKRWSLSDSG